MEQVSTTRGYGTGRIGRRLLIPGPIPVRSPPWSPPRLSSCSEVLIRSIRLRLTASCMAIRGAGTVMHGPRPKTLDRRRAGVMGWRFGATPGELCSSAGRLSSGVMRDTWEHPEAADDTGGGGGGTGVEVKSVAVIALGPLVSGLPGGVLRSMSH
jgi:hypothetical protein